MRAVPYVELSRKLVRTAKIASPAYYINIGGAGSLEVPVIEPHLCAADPGHFWRAVCITNTSMLLDTCLYGLAVTVLSGISRFGIPDPIHGGAARAVGNRVARIEDCAAQSNGRVGY